MVGIVVSVAIAWSTAPLLADLLGRRRAAGRGPSGGGDDAADVTTLVRLGDEPADVALTSVVMAAHAGPAAILCTGDRAVPDEIRDTGVRIARGTDLAEAVADAVATVDSHAVLIVSARALPRGGACRSAAGRLDGDLAWVVGRVAPVSSEGFAPDGRDAVGARLRHRARRAGLELWESDAVLLRTDLLRRHPLQDGQPLGSWLRDRRAEGLRGATTDEILSLRSTPLDAASFWPDTIARQRAAAAELSRAAASGAARHRAIAGLLLARELYTVPLLGWLLLPVLLGTSGRFPFDLPAASSVAVVAALLALRWWSLRAALGLARHPVADAVSALHHLPGSLSAVPAAVTGRVRPRRRPSPRRPLEWAALALTVAAGAMLVARDAGAPVSKLSVGTSLVSLVALWVFSVRSLVQRNWRRGTHRTPLDLPATVTLGGGRPLDGRTADASPTGLAIELAHDVAPAAGVEATLQVRLDDGSTLDVPARVAAARHRTSGTTVGLALELDEGSRPRWLAQLQRALEDPDDAGSRRSSGPSVPTAAGPRGWRGRATDVVDRVVPALVAGVSLAVVAALALVMLGFEPLVVRSESMVPTFAVGDVVFAEHVPAADLVPGDVVTQPDGASADEAVTHRLRSVRRDGALLEMETRGDANPSSERWTVRADELVGRVRWSVPLIGRVATGVRTSSAQLGVTAAALAVVVVALLRPRRQMRSGVAASS